jgi:AraC-like DNA-binding protein
MQEINLLAFFIGVATTYFIINAINLLQNKSRTRLQTVLGWILVLWTLLNLKDIFAIIPRPLTTKEHYYFVLFDGWVAFTYAIMIYEVTTPGWTTWRRVVKTALPFLLFTIVFFVWPTSLIINLYGAFLVVYTLAIIVIAVIKARRYNRYIRNNYSNIDEIDISWVNKVLLMTLLSQVTWVISTLYPGLITDTVYYFFTLLMWQKVISYSRRMRPVPIEKMSQHPDNVETTRSFAFAGALEDIVETRELYMNQELTLADLAKAVNTNRTYLSYYFSNVKKTTFYDYINQLRITKKSLPMMREHPEYTLDYVAAMSGFKSISTFRRAFIKLTGTSPSQYIHQNKNVSC